jgi:hypothetical protein
MEIKQGLKYVHKGNGNVYEVISPTGESDQDYTIKQSSKDEWENPIYYMSCDTYQQFITGEKRFLDRFKLVEDND